MVAIVLFNLVAVAFVLAMRASKRQRAFDPEAARRMIHSTPRGPREVEVDITPDAEAVGVYQTWLVPAQASTR